LTAELATWTTELAAVRAWFQDQPINTHNKLSLPDLELECAWILDGLAIGFRIVEALPAPYTIENYVIPPSHARAIDADIQEELQAGRIFPCAAKPAWLTPLFGKTEGPDKFRVLRDYSVAKADERAWNPLFTSVNEAAWSNTFSLSSVDDALKLITPLCYMAKVDISKAYRYVPVHPEHWKLLSFSWGGKFYSDSCLPFGLKNAPEIFTRITDLVQLMMQRRGFNVVVYVDDFFVCAPTETLCQEAWTILIELLTALGFTVNRKMTKSVPPTRDLVFLGIRLLTDVAGDGTGAMEARVPESKLKELLQTIDMLNPRTSVSTKARQRLLGKLNFVSRVIYGARPYTRRLIDAMSAALRQDKGTVAITPAVRLDL
jgi:hypothetical protein